MSASNSVAVTSPGETTDPQQGTNVIRPSHGTADTKVAVFLRPVGDAPSLKKQKFKLDGAKPILEVEKFLIKSLAAATGASSSSSSSAVRSIGSIVLYCGSGFSPTPDQLVNDLFACFQENGELIITYSIQETWG